MNVSIPGRPRRAIVLAAEEHRVHLPISAGGFPFFSLEPERRAASIQAAAASRADVTFVVDPHELTREEVARLPGLRVGVVLRALFGSAPFEKLAALARAPGFTEGFAGYTWHRSELPEPARGLNIIGTLPPVLDLARLPAVPATHGPHLLVPEWARPPAWVMDRLKGAATVQTLPLRAELTATIDALSRASTVLFWGTTAEPLGLFDSLPWLALGAGTLLLANGSFPAECGIEPEDEYLSRPDGEAFARAAERALREPALQLVRVRAHQKIREAFAAGPAFQRLAHDALLFDGLLEADHAAGGAGGLRGVAS